MNIIHAAVAGVALASVAAIGCAQAGDHGDPRWHHHHRLPPLSGTIHVPPGGFGAGSRRYVLEGHGLASHVTFHHSYGYYGRDYAYGQPRRWGYGQGSVYWNRRVPFYGEGNDTLAMTVTGGGTADSATTGGAYPLPSPRRHAAVPVQVSYGTPSFGYGEGRSLSRSYAPTGGLGYYSSGSPGQMAYYSSSSSAGPGGTPGGLGIYSSGAFGPGAKIIHVGGRNRSGWNEGGNGGPHIIHVGRRRHWASN